MKQPDGTADLAIEAAVTNWRASVRGLAGRELDELTDHVASSARALMESNLAPDEAVLIAARRLGAEQELVREFERGDGRLRQFDPLALLLIGAAAALVIGPLARVPMYAAALVSRFVDGSEPEWASAATTLAVLAPVALLIPLVRWRGAARALTYVAGKPLVALAVAFALIWLPEAVQVGMAYVVTPQEMANALSFRWPHAAALFAPGLIAPLALLFVGLRRARRAPAE